MSANILSDDFEIHADVASLLDGMVEPIALVSVEGLVRYQNPAFRKLCGPVVGRRFIELEQQDKARLELFLRRSSGTSSALFGTIQLDSDHTSRHRTLARRVQFESGPAIVVQLDAQAERRFAQLTRQVNELNKEIAERRHAQAILQESLRERELLIRELQHRVKNNMQMLESMLRRAEREAAAPEAKAAIQDVSGKIKAVAAVQRLLYTDSNPTTVFSEDLLAAVIASVASLAPPDVLWHSECENTHLGVSTATVVALILNELLTNAVKHGRPAADTPRIIVSIQKLASGFDLVVADNGPGFTYHECVAATSGLSLVQGLVRQIAGTLSIELDQGTIVRVFCPEER